jgi:UDP-N-acetylmuramoylalanine--D-glutamate ligase
MRHPISWSELTSASVGVWGLGVEGTATIDRLREMGTVPVLVEDTPSAPSVGDLEILATGQGGLDALLQCDVVVKSPGISRYRDEVIQLEASGVPVRGGLGLWLEEADRRRIACITGTKGKSTTTALAVHLLTQLGHTARAGGNIGQPPWGPSAGPEPDYWVIETSSFQVPDVTTGPSVVAVTSLSPDHLDWHGSVERYYADKLSLCTKPGVSVALVEGTDPLLRARGSTLGPHPQWVGEPGGPDTEWTRSLSIPGRHNVRNAAMARAVLIALGIPGADDDQVMGAALLGFDGLPSRCRSLGYVGATEFVDDSLSTNVLPAQAALDAYADRPVAILVGGHDRGLDYAPLGQSVLRREHPTVVITMPDNGPRIGSAIRRAAGDRVTVLDADDLAGAVSQAFSWAKGAPDSGAGAVVLLSPAAPSFGRFSDYRDRGRAFADAAARCGPLRPAPAPRAR